MKKKVNTIVIPELEFDFESDELYTAARRTGIIEDYKMARITRVHSNGYSVDYPCHSREELVDQIYRWIKEEGVESFTAYQSVHYYDVREYYDE